MNEYVKPEVEFLEFQTEPITSTNPDIGKPEVGSLEDQNPLG